MELNERDETQTEGEFSSDSSTREITQIIVLERKCFC